MALRGKNGKCNRYNSNNHDDILFIICNKQKAKSMRQKMVWEYKNKTKEELKKEYQEQHVYVMRFRGRTPHPFEKWCEMNQYVVKDEK